MSKKQQAVMAKADDNTAALAALADLDVQDDGLHEIDQSDIKLSTRTLNMPGVDGSGEEIPKAAYYDTVDETVKKKVRATFVSVHKTNVYMKFDSAENRNKVICRSDDLVTGTMRDTGEQRPCKGCPDTRWYTTVGDDGQKRNVRNCTLIHNVVAYDHDDQKLFTVRFKKGALREWTTYLNKHHLGKGKQAGLKKSDVPLFFYEAELSAKLDGTYALPVIERGRVLTPEEVQFQADGASFIRERAAEISAAADNFDTDDTNSEGDTSFDTDTFGGSAGQDVQL